MATYIWMQAELRVSMCECLATYVVIEGGGYCTYVASGCYTTAVRRLVVTAIGMTALPSDLA